jgi:hypothetical protein
LNSCKDLQTTNTEFIKKTTKANHQKKTSTFMRSNRLLQPVEIPNSSSYYLNSNFNHKETAYNINETSCAVSPHLTKAGKIPNSNLIQESRMSLKSKKKDLGKALSPLGDRPGNSSCTNLLSNCSEKSQNLNGNRLLKQEEVTPGCRSPE